MNTIEDTLHDLKALFNNAPDLAGTIRKYIDENAGLKKQVEDFMKEKEAQLKERLLKNVQEVNGVKVIKFCAPLPAETVKNIAFQLRGQNYGKPVLRSGNRSRRQADADRHAERQPRGRRTESR